MRPSCKLSLIAFTLLVFCMFQTSMVAQVTISSWTYEPYQGALNNPTPNAGSGTSGVVNNGGGTLTPGIRTGMAGTGCGDQNGANAWALEPFNPGSINQGNGAQFSAPMTGYQNIRFSWDQRWSNTAPNTVRLQYTLDGTTWSNFTMTTSNTTYCLGSINASGCFQTDAQGDKYRRISVDLSSITGATNNASFGLRLLAAHYQATGQFRSAADPAVVAGSGGTWRFDNVRFEGTLIPGPTASVLSGATTICQGNTANLYVNITGGQGPFTVVYSNGVSNFTVTNYTSGAAITLTPASTRTYSIVSVTNANGQVGSGNSGTPTITVNPLPSGTPSSASFASCTASVTFTGSAPGSGNTGSFTYDAAGTMPITMPYGGPSTVFYYKVSTAAGCYKIAGPYTFTRNNSVTITTNPSTTTQTTCQGSAFSPLSVTATGSGTLTYQWFWNATASNVGGTSIASSNAATYTPAATTAGTRYYYVRISNSCGTVSSAVSGAITVVAQPVAGTVSPAQTVCAGYEPSDLSLSGYTGTIVKWQRSTDPAFLSGVSDIANTTATLSGAAIGPLTVTTYFQAVVNNAYCADVFASVMIEVKATTWNGSSWSAGTPDGTMGIIFNGNYSSTGDLAGCSAVVNSGTVMFNPGHSLVLENGLQVNAGSLTFEDTASLVQKNPAANSGFISYQRTTTPVRRYDYTYWSSPVDSQIMANVSPLTLSDKYFWWDATIYGWVTVSAPALSVMEVGKGYIIRAPQTYDTVTPALYTATFEGTPNNDEVPVNIVVNGANNLNLLGNPYPCAIDADIFMSDPENTAAIGTGTTLYFWTHNSNVSSNQYTFSDYATYNYTGGTGTAAATGANSNIPNGKINAAQGFFVKGLATGTAKFKHNMKVVGNNNQFFRQADLGKSRFWLELSDADIGFKQLLIGYVPGATNDFDAGFDAPIANGSNTVGIYSLLGSEKLSVQGRSDFDASDIVPLGYFATSAGEMTIHLAQFDGLFQGQEIFLKDLENGTETNLKTSDYSFQTIAGTFDQRFEIRYQSTALSTENPSAPDAIVLFEKDGQLVVDSPTGNLEKIHVYDMAGRLVGQTQSYASARLSLDALPIHQALVVRITLTDGSEISRKALLTGPTAR